MGFIQRVLHSGDILGTLFGHSGARGPKGPGDTPWDTPGGTPVFGNTLGDTPGDTPGPKGSRDPCSRPGGSQIYSVEHVTNLRHARQQSDYQRRCTKQSAPESRDGEWQTIWCELWRPKQRTVAPRLPAHTLPVPESTPSPPSRIILPAF